MSGRKLFAERDRFGKWQHLLGPRTALVAHTVDTPKHGLIRRLEVQTHLGPEGENDLCEPRTFQNAWNRLLTFMGMRGILPPEDPGCVRVDPAVDVVFERSEDGRDVLEALRHARWSNGWYAEYQGPPPYTTVAIKRQTKIVGRVYCRNTKLRNGGPRWGKLRFEREQRFEWRDRRPVAELSLNDVARGYWSLVFGAGVKSGEVVRVSRERQTEDLIPRVQTGELTTSQFEQVSAFLDVERLGVVDRVYRPETARRRRALAAMLGIAVTDAESVPLALDLDALMAVARAAWDETAEDVPGSSGPT
jgi:hypothetical protein